jgi:hypothetical protein
MIEWLRSNRYYRARYYHPTLQRFISEDPIGFEGGDVNLYAYVANAPMDFVDPSGMSMAPGAIPEYCRDLSYIPMTPELSGRKGFIAQVIASEMALLGLVGRALDCSIVDTPAGIVRSGGKAGWAFWKITKQGTERVARHRRFGNFYRSRSDGLWWSRDKAGHGGSRWKVFEETAEGLRWRADADEFGTFITGKHRSGIGEIIPWSELAGSAR